MIRGRGVHYLEGEIACPLAGIGPRGERASIRLAFDDDHSEATLDRDRRRLVITNRRSYAEPTLIGDLIVLGRGRTRAGHTVPIALHTRFDKTRTELRARPHLHPTVAGTLAAVELEPLEVIVNGRIVLTAELGRRVATHPPLPDWLGRALFSIRPGPARDAIVDLSVGLGLGRLAIPLVRAELFGPRHASRDLRALLATDSWELRFTIQARVPDLLEHLGRAVFLLGLDDVPALRRVREGRLGRGETLSFRMQAGAGTVEVGGERARVEDLAAAARAYLEYDILGSVIAQAMIAGQPPADEIVV